MSDQSYGLKKILIISPSLKMGGMERAACNLANIFADKGYNVYYYVIFKNKRFFKLNNNIILIEPEGEINPQRLKILRTLFKIRKTVKITKPDTIIVFNKFYSAVTMVALAGIKVPIFISDRASPLFSWPIHIAVFNKIIFGLLKPTGAIAQTIVAAEYQAKYFSRKTKIAVIPNLLKEVKCYDIKKENIILAVGRLNDALKGFDRLIEAFSKIYAPDWKLVFAGGDEEGEQLQQQAKKLGISDRVNYLGKVGDIDRIYSEAKIFVIPSRSEGFPNALCEAMAAGLPCISFDFIAGPRELIINDYNGYIVENGNINELAKKIKYLIENEAERSRIGKNAIAIREKLNKEVITNNLLEFVIK
jgi:glycosyltransferase involved in cell wall biosynthesis